MNLNRSALRLTRNLLRRYGFHNERPLRSKQQSLQLISSRGFRPDIVVDVGVAVGTQGLYRVWPDAHFVLVEPLRKFAPTIEGICRSMRSASYQIAACGAVPGQLEIAVDPDHAHNFQPAESAPPDWERDSIPVVRVDDIVASAPRPVKSGVIKIDVDGAEIDVLEGAKESLSLDMIVVIEAALMDEKASRFRIDSFDDGRARVRMLRYHRATLATLGSSVVAGRFYFRAPRKRPARG